MPPRHHRRNEYGFDVPLHRDWLFWSLLPLAGLVAILAVVTERAQPGEAVLQIGGALTIAGVLIGSVRELVRGFREPREKITPARVRSGRH
jgi:hypothetical protein